MIGQVYYIHDFHECGDYKIPFVIVYVLFETNPDKKTNRYHHLYIYIYIYGCVYFVSAHNVCVMRTPRNVWLKRFRIDYSHVVQTFSDK